jgi:acetyltransferase
VKNFFQPSSVAVIGASDKPGKVGRVVLENLIQSRYPGRIYPVNPSHQEIMGYRTYPSVLELPETPGLVVIIIPAHLVPGAMEECGKKGVDSTIVISAGFKEAGREGYQLEKELERVARKYAIRVLGPNCLGLVDTSTPLNVSFASIAPSPGHIAFVSQSGALCTAALGWAEANGLGFSRFISIGNKMDIDETDLFQALVDDDNTRVIAAYLEGIRRGEEFLRLAREVARRKPVVVFKAGTTQAGAKAVSSHTGTLAGSENAYIASFKKTGIIRADTVEDLLQISRGFSRQPIPRGPGVAILTNAGGPGIITADAIEHMGLQLAALDSATIKKLREGLPLASNIYNPVDVLGDALADRYEVAMKALYHDPGVDAVICILTPQAMTQVMETAQKIVEVTASGDKTVLTVFMGGGEVDPAEELLRNASIPNYRFPEEAVRTLRAMVDYRGFLHKPDDRVLHFPVEKERVEEVLERALKDGRYQLGEIEARQVLECYGIPVARTKLATNLEECILAGREIGYPVVAKIASPQILHKTDVGGVRVNIGNTDELITAYEEITTNVNRYVPDAQIWGVVVQEMLPPSRELIVGMSRDSQFGPLLMVGLGGVYVEILKDISFRLAPIGEREAMEMLQELKSYWLLQGARGERPADITEVVEVILRVSQLVTDFPRLEELDINPLRVYEKGKGCIAADARIVLGE